MKVCPACTCRFTAQAWRCPRCGWEAVRHNGIRCVMQDAPDGFSAGFYAALTRVETEHFWFRGRNALIAWALTRYFADARTFLEVGCGTGQVVRALRHTHPELAITASEAFFEGLTVAAAHVRGAEFVQADARRLPWEDEFDVVGAFDVLEHVVEDEAAMQNIARAVRPGGGVLVTVPQHPWLWSPIDDFSHHQRRYSRPQLVALLKASGLKVMYVTSFVSLLLPALLLSRIAARNRPPDPAREVRINPLVNGLGGLALGLERGLIRAGASLPAGGSLLAVAKR